MTISAQGPGVRLRGAYRVTAVLPAVGGELTYRVKSDSEQWERVVGESRLLPLK